MNKTRWFGLALLLGALLISQETFAQNPLQELQKKVDENFPRGRFFRKLREDAQAREEKKEQQKKQREQEKLEKERERMAKEAQKRGGFRPPQPNQPNLASQPNLANRPQGGPQFRGPQAIPQFAPGDLRQPTPGQAPSGQPMFAQPNTQMPTPDFGQPGRIAAKPPVKGGIHPQGFGVVLVEKQNQLQVAELDPQGNAAKAGLRRGDVINQIGGVDISTLDEFDEITKLMGNGDQIEFGIVRGGKKSSQAVTFGSVSETDLEKATELATPPGIDLETANDFAPPVRTADSQVNPNSILDRPTSSSRGSSQDRLPPPVQKETKNLEQIIEDQQKTIERLERELQRLKQSLPPRDDDPPIG